MNPFRELGAVAELTGVVRRWRPDIVHLVAQRLTDRTDALLRLAPGGLATAMAHADEVNRPPAGPLADPASPANAGHPRNARLIPKSRDFH